MVMSVRTFRYADEFSDELAISCEQCGNKRVASALAGSKGNGEIRELPNGLLGFGWFLAFLEGEKILRGRRTKHPTRCERGAL
jgi:hypothetical protein